MSYLINGEYDFESIVNDAIILHQTIGGNPSKRLDQIIRRAQSQMLIFKLREEVFIDKLKDRKRLIAFNKFLSKQGLESTIVNGAGIILKNNRPVAHFYKGTRAAKNSKDTFILPDEKGNTFYIHQTGRVFDFLDLIRKPDLLKC